MEQLPYLVAVLCLQILPLNPLAPPAGSVITYDALDLMWLHGLDDIRALTRLSEGNNVQKVSETFKCQSMADLNWYCNWKGLAADAQFFEKPPVVATVDLLHHLGVPQQHISALLANMTVEMLSSLRCMVLPQFVQQALELMADQLPGIPLILNLQRSCCLLSERCCIQCSVSYIATAIMFGFLLSA